MLKKKILAEVVQINTPSLLNSKSSPIPNVFMKFLFIKLSVITFPPNFQELGFLCFQTLKKAKSITAKHDTGICKLRGF